MRLRAEGIAVRYGAFEALRGVSLEAAPGEVLVVLGANGSGKSSLLRVLAGVQASRGVVRWDGPETAVGFMPQDSSARPALSVFEVVLLGRLRRLGLRVADEDLVAAEAALAEVGIAHLAQRRIGTLSGGQRQMAFLAQVLAAGPRALLLDEPTSALDIAHQLHVLALLRGVTRRLGVSTVAVLHDLNAAARFADRIAVLADGVVLAFGEPEAVLTPEVLRAAYGVRVAVQAGPDGRPVVIPLEALACG